MRRARDGDRAAARRVAWTEYGPEFKDDSLTVKIAVFNRGNRQGLIGRMELVRLAFRDGSISSKAWGPGQTVHPVLPLLVDPGEMVSLRLTMPYQAQDWFNHSFECDSATTPTPGTRCANLGISWGVVNSEGESFNGSAMVAFLYVEPKGVTGAATFANPIHLYVQGI